jgi:hypothetical protein
MSKHEINWERRIGEGNIISRGKIAYDEALIDLQEFRGSKEWNYTVKSALRFNYGEGGSGILLPHNLAYISSEATEDIRRIIFDGKLQIGENGWLPSGVKWGSINGRIPKEAIEDVLDVARGLRARIRSGEQFAPIS